MLENIYVSLYYVCMNSKLIRNWIEANDPLGIEKLAIASGLSSETLKRASYGIYTIKKKYNLNKLAKALGCTVEELLKKEENAS